MFDVCVNIHNKDLIHSTSVISQNPQTTQHNVVSCLRSEDLPQCADHKKTVQTLFNLGCLSSCFLKKKNSVFFPPWKTIMELSRWGERCVEPVRHCGVFINPQRGGDKRFRIQNTGNLRNKSSAITKKPTTTTTTNNRRKKNLTVTRVPEWGPADAFLPFCHCWISHWCRCAVRSLCVCIGCSQAPPPAGAGGAIHHGRGSSASCSPASIRDKTQHSPNEHR